MKRELLELLDERIALVITRVADKFLNGNFEREFALSVRQSMRFLDTRVVIE
ncbi:MAG: hypothetical protein LBJ36_11525 [Synergistaceae bacterium]|nr:hypothetical protein [Synergistaceae bacterium]